MGDEEPGQLGPHGARVFCNRKRMYVWVASENGDGRAEKPRYDVPQGVGVKNRYEAELTNQRRGSGSQT